MCDGSGECAGARTVVFNNLFLPLHQTSLSPIKLYTITSNSANISSNDIALQINIKIPSSSMTISSNSS